MKTIICSHGFGVRADSLGMLPEIAAALPDYNFKMFDYNEYAENGDSTFRSLHHQAKVLEDQINAVDKGKVVLLCHSQGCLIPAYANIERVSKVVLLAPPDTMGSKRVIDRFGKRPGAIFNLEGMSLVPRSDGSTTYIPQEYFSDIDEVQPLKAIQKIADTKLTVIVRALQDEIIGLTRVDEIKNAQCIDMNADHNFTGKNRGALIEVLRATL